jgi:hypothetical protein
MFHPAGFLEEEFGGVALYEEPEIPIDLKAFWPQRRDNGEVILLQFAEILSNRNGSKIQGSKDGDLKFVHRDVLPCQGS